jgi:hypothetical protein
VMQCTRLSVRSRTAANYLPTQAISHQPNMCLQAALWVVVQDTQCILHHVEAARRNDHAL